MKQKKPFDKCPVCGGDLQEKEVEKLLKGGDNTAMVNVRAEVCLHCGERLYSQEAIKCFEEIRRKLEKKDVASFKMIGNAYHVTASDSV